MINIAVINLKGGVGKSVTTCNLAAQLAAEQYSVLVVDVDKQGNTSKFFKHCDYEQPSLAEVLLDSAWASDAIVDTSLPCVDLLPADMRMLKANRNILMDVTEPQQYRLRDALRKVAANYCYCLMDCPPDLDMGSINALCAADWVIIPVDCDEWACDGMAEILDQIARVQMYYNPHLKILGVLLTKYRNTKYADGVITHLAQMGVPLLHTAIRYTVRVSEAKSAHLPLREYKQNCTAALDYADLAREIVEKVSTADTREE